MEAEHRSLLRRLLTEQRVLALCVLVDDAPYVSQMPFAMRPDFGSFLVLASRLGRHSRGLVDWAQFAALVRAPDDPSRDPFQVPRVTLRGSVRAVRRQTEEFDVARRVYLDKLPTGSLLFDLGDFTMYEMWIDKVRFVAGFASAHTVSAQALRELAQPERE